MADLKDVFISYSTKDQEAKEFIKNAFDKQGVSYFLDENDLELGEDVEYSLKANLRNTRFTVLLVSKNSLFSTWVCLETIHRLQEESFTQKVSFLPVLVDLSVMSMDFPLEMARHFKAKSETLEAKRVEAKQLGIATKLYNDEIERIEKVMPQIGEIIQKIKNSLIANFADESRKIRDVEKLLQRIRENANTKEKTTNPAPTVNDSDEKLLQEVIFITPEMPEAEKVKLFERTASNPKLLIKQIKTSEEQIYEDYTDFAYPEINVEVSFRLFGNSTAEKDFGLYLEDDDDKALFFNACTPNFFQLGYQINKDEDTLFNDIEDEGWEESSIFTLETDKLITLRIQIITDDTKPLKKNTKATLKYYIDNQIVFIAKEFKIEFLPLYISLYKNPVKNAELLGFKVYLG
jgi:hypothetical protein